MKTLGTGVILAICLASKLSVAGPATSTNYSLTPSSLNPGGSGSSTDYSLSHGTLGAITGFSSSADYSNRSGYSSFAGPDINVEQPEFTTLGSGISTVDFGSTIGTDPVQRTFTIRNTGRATLENLVLSITGPNAADFDASPLPQTSLDENESLQFTMTFISSGGGTRAASLQIANSDADENPYVVDLQGFGIPESTIGDWKDGFGLSGASDSSDGDSDFVELLYEYGFNLDPTQPDPQILTPATGTAGLPSIRVLNDAGSFRIETEYIRRRGDRNLQYIVEFGSGLQPVDWEAATGTQVVSPIDENWERVLILDTETAPPLTERFGRVRLELPSP